MLRADELREDCGHLVAHNVMLRHRQTGKGPFGNPKGNGGIKTKNEFKGHVLGRSLSPFLAAGDCQFCHQCMMDGPSLDATLTRNGGVAWAWPDPSQSETDVYVFHVILVTVARN